MGVIRRSTQAGNVRSGNGGNCRSSTPGRILIKALALLAIAGTAAFTVPPSVAQQTQPVKPQTQPVKPRQPERVVVPQHPIQSLGMEVAVNKSQVLRVDRPFTDLAVGKSEIADVIPLTNQSVYVLGKAIGSTTLSIYGQNHLLIAVINVVVTPDVGDIRAELHQVLPRERIEVRSANGSVVLGGLVSSAEAAGRAVEIAQQYAPGKIVNMMTVKGTQQVMLAVRVAEMDRTVARDLGIKPSILVGKNARSSFNFTTLDAVNVNAFASGVLNWQTGFLSLSTLIDALEQKNLVKILAEPNLVALSGDTASFLAGGEFPVPEVQATTGNLPTIAVTFKQFGVSLAFTPTVIDGDLINLVVSPEVSQIDTSNAVTISGFSIPGISTRRARTTIELRDGQSFAIAGLLQSNITDQVRQLPGLGEVPILGALFRDTTFQNKETELVIIVTPSLIKPAPAGSLASPTDTFVPPSTADLFFKGEVETPNSGLPSARRALGASTGGGLDGQYGYIVK